MQRRQFLLLFSRGVYATCGLTLAATVSRFLGAPLAGTSGASTQLRTRVAMLDSLPVGEPQLRPIEGTRTNGWVKAPSRVIGNVWITRLSDAETPPEQAEVSVFNAACPHNGCPIQKAMTKGFACHCHGARFDTTGKLVPDSEEFTNPSPRGMDPLEHGLVQDPESGQWWVEVVYQTFETGLAERVAVA